MRGEWRRNHQPRGTAALPCTATAVGNQNRPGTCRLYQERRTSGFDGVSGFSSSPGELVNSQNFRSRMPRESDHLSSLRIVLGD